LGVRKGSQARKVGAGSWTPVWYVLRCEDRVGQQQHLDMPLVPKDE
jgi:hypothetical protein